MTESIFDEVGGQEALLELARAWHARCLADPVVSHAFSHGVHPQHVERLASYWAEALGGPPNYSDTLSDETTVIRLHSGNGEHQEMDERAIECFIHALDDVGLSGQPALASALIAYFRWATQTMSKYPQSPHDVPATLEIGRWSWDGPVAP